MAVKDFLERLVNFENLSFSETEELFEKIMEGSLTDAQIASVLVALRMKGETDDEIAAAAKVMRQKSRKLNLPEDVREKLIDTCGTGGDRKGTFNVSTLSALLLAACDVPVAKHGNRSISSKMGSADILEALGVRVDLPPEKVSRSIVETGFGFMFAPVFHPAMANVMKARREIGIRTVFNILGPLTNPAEAKRQLLGVFSHHLTEKLAYVLKKLGSERVFVVHGEDGTDEITVCGKTKITELHKGEVKTYFVSPTDYGMPIRKPEEIAAPQSIEEAAYEARELLKGKLGGAKEDMVVLNSAFALYAAGKSESVKDAIELARETLKSGRAYEKLEEVAEFSRRA